MQSEEKIGTRGLEPPTSPTPRVRATRLRYVPSDSSTLGLAVEQSQDVLEFGPYFVQLFGGCILGVWIGIAAT